MEAAEPLVERAVLRRLEGLGFRYRKVYKSGYMLRGLAVDEKVDRPELKGAP